MNRTLKLLFFVVTSLFSTITFSQNTVTGTVLDGESNSPLPGVNILELGTTNGVSTDFDGNFTLTTDSSNAKINVSYVGYLSQEFTVTDSKNLGAITLAPSEFGLQEVNILASVAIDRKTPVAVSTVKAADIELKLGSQEFPEVLKSTPGVYATKSGGGYGDGRINLRGFSSENVAVMINGVPVNDMENGRVYWSNWTGLGDVTRSMQVQRGLGASKVAVPSIGGTINIVTKSTDVESGGNIAMSVGNDGYQKYGATYSTGLLDNGLAVTVSAAKVFGDGYVEGTQFDGVNYFLNVSKNINENHKLSFTAFGAKQVHGQRFNRKTIEDYRATESGGKKFNADWGYYNGQVENAAYNFYHKPQMSLNHFWTIGEDTSLSTAAYASFGNGGGRREQGSKIGSDEYRLGASDQPIDFDRIAEENKALGVLGSSDILSNSNNSHKWYGVLSTLKTRVGDKLTILGGLDGRYYVGSHWYEVYDLLGGEFFLNTTSSDNTFNQALKVGDRFNKDYDATSVNLGVFAQAEYDFSDNVSGFLASSVSNTTYSKVDFMKYAANDPERTSDKADFIGYSFKSGANYNLDDYNNVFANIGYFSRAPFLNGNVFLSTRSTDLNTEAINEKVFSAEIGYGYRSSNFSANVNLYRTSWLDKSLVGTVGNPDPTADRLTYNVPGLDALHQGVEVDFLYKINSSLKATGMVSLGDWKWKNDATGTVFAPDGTPVEEINVYAKDLKVTDAAQTTFSLGLDYQFLPDSQVYLDYNYAGDLYASYFITDRKDKSNRENSWKVPAYGLFDVGLKHGFKIGDFETTVIGKINNVLNTEYVSDANDGEGSNVSTAMVYYGAGRTFSVGAKIKF